LANTSPPSSVSIFPGIAAPAFFARQAHHAARAAPHLRDAHLACDQGRLITLNRAQFEALFSGLDWRRVKALEARRPAAAE